MTSVGVRMRWACILTALTGAVALALVTSVDGVHIHRDWMFPFFAGVLLFAYARPVRFWHDGQSENISLDEALFVPMVLLLTPTEMMLAIGGAITLGFLIRRTGWAKLIWNFGATTISAAVALGAYHLLVHLASADVLPGQSPPAFAVVSAFVGGLVYDVVNAGLVAHIISIVESRSFTSVLREGALVRAATWIGALSLGVLVAFAAAHDHVILVLVILPVAVLHVTYAAAVAQWRERQRIEAMYTAARSIQDSIDGAEVRKRLMDAARQLLGAGRAAVVPDAGEPQAGALRVALASQSALEVDNRIVGGTWDRRDEDVLRALAAVAAGALHNAELYEQIRVLTSSLGEGVFAVDREGRTWFMNPAAGEMLGWTSEQIIGQPLHDRIGAEREFESCFLHRVLATGEVIRNDDGLFTRGDGSMLPVASTTAPVIRDGEVQGAVVTFRDVTERKAFELQLAHQAFHDALTDLPNRALFLDRLQHAMARTRSSTRHALLFIDIDRFKVVNDSLGHQVGDELLTAVAQRLRTCLRGADTLARFGGDEFTVLMEDIPDVDDALALAERINATLAGPFTIDGRELVVSASIGIACTAEDHDRTADELVAFADIAMYRAKAKGGGTADIYDAETEDRTLERLEMEIALRQAIQMGQLEVFYQPVFSVTTGRITGTEALVRWNHPTLGQVLPGGFITLAEETGLIVPLGRFVLLEACCQTREWQEQHPDAPPLTISVNLSTRQLQRTTLIEDVQDILAVSGLDPAVLCLEITESAMLEEAAVVTANLAGLKRLGVRLAIDDFGTGYSSLSYLKRFPVDVVKIDRSFTSGLGQRDVDRDIVTAIVQLARAIGAQAVAEGVETPSQLDELRAVGCPGAQGFFLSRPKPRHEIEHLLEERWAREPVAHAAS